MLIVTYLQAKHPLKRLDKGMKSVANQKASKLNRHFPIVGIGASAGGLDALTLFFTNLPTNTGMGFIVIQHLDPTQKGMLPELLQRQTKMQVTQAKNNSLVNPNKIYVIPPNKSITIRDGVLHLSEIIETNGLRLPIDIFFRSLAKDQADNGVGIILSGMGSDGSIGLKAIKQAGGLTLVQAPSTAKFESMPLNGISQASPDFIAKAEELPDKLITHTNIRPYKSPSAELNQASKNELDKIISLLLEHTNQDFSQYKKNTLLRRIERRKAVHLLPTSKDYIKYLQENTQECKILSKELLIGVTNFFRDTAVWKRLREEVIPKIIETATNGAIIRAWVVACSTGEEAYSLAMTFNEVIEKIGKDKKLTSLIFATDLDTDAINYARTGLYRPTIKSEVSKERLDTFFSKVQEGYKVKGTIREMIVFAPQNLLTDPPFLNLDFISCRNLLIYLESTQQKKVLDLLSYCLNTEGIMVLGTAETSGTSNKNFTEIDNKLKIFKRTSSNLNDPVFSFPNSNFHKLEMKNESKHKVNNTENIQELTDQLLLQYFSPASVLINSQGDVIYINGSTGKYLEPAKGKANLNIYAMAREGLRELLPGGVREATQVDKTVKIPGVTTNNGNQKSLFSVSIMQIQKPEALNGNVLIVFHDDDSGIKKPQAKTKKGDKTQFQLNLEQELSQTQEMLKTTREEMQVSSEESKSINEELQSTNEELQSTNEELTTSKEEMQSLNEELQTVNSELQVKINDFKTATSDMKNLLRTTELATLFLEKELNIRRFTDSVTHIFKLREIDIGRPFTDIVNYLNYPELESESKRVLETLLPFETIILVKDENWLKIRIVPYRTIDDRIDGLVMTFTDITELEKLKAKMKSLE